MAMIEEIFIDGYNVIKNQPMFQALVHGNIASARELLVRQLKQRYQRQSTYRITVVFDGDGETEQVQHDDHIRIIFSRYNETADAVIIRLTCEARQAGLLVTMCSHDSEIRDAVRGQGGTVYTPTRLIEQIHAAPRNMTARVQHRQMIRRLYGIDPRSKYEQDNEEWEREQRHHHHKKTKKSSRRRR